MINKPCLADAKIDWIYQPHSKLRIITDPQSTNQLWLNIKLDQGWYIYWYKTLDTGEPTSIQLVSQNTAKIKHITWPVPIRKIFAPDLEGFIYSGEVLIPVKLELSSEESLNKIKLFVSYIICNDSCIPVTTTLDTGNFVYPGNTTDIISKATKHLPGLNGQYGLHINNSSLVKSKKGLFLKVTAHSDQGFTDPDIIVEEPTQISFGKPDIYLDNDRKEGIFWLPIEQKNTNKQTINTTLLLTDNGHGVQDNAITRLTTITAADESLLGQTQQDNKPFLAVILVFAFLGGLLLNIMPCVLPVLSIKLFSILSQRTKANRREIVYSLLANSLGIIATFIALAIITTSFAAFGKTIGWGMQFSQPVFLICLILILVFFACNLLGLFEINLPLWLTDNLAIINTSRHQMVIGNFLNGVIATILATPCTAPFLGSAISFALSRGTSEIILVFLVIGVGMSLPCLILCAFPGAIHYLPKPGPWMQKLKTFFGIMLFATVLWLLFIISAQLGNKAAILLFLLCLLLKFALENRAGLLRYSLVKFATLAILIFCAFYVTLTTGNLTKRHDNYVHSIWQEFDQNKIQTFIAEGKVVIVDVTADWCLLCKVNKMMVLNRDDILAYLTNPNIVAMRADLTSDKNNTAILAYLKNHHRYGIPFNVVYGPNAKKGIVLSEMLTPSKLIIAINQAGLRP